MTASGIEKDVTRYCQVRICKQILTISEVTESFAGEQKSRPLKLPSSSSSIRFLSPSIYPECISTCSAIILVNAAFETRVRTTGTHRPCASTRRESVTTTLPGTVSMDHCTSRSFPRPAMTGSHMHFPVGTMDRPRDRYYVGSTCYSGKASSCIVYTNGMTVVFL